MLLNITTTQLDASVALNAYRYYKSGDYEQAIPNLLDILDREPNNWQARLFLAACYFNTNQRLAAQRAFRFVFENCTDAELKKKAGEALHVVTSDLYQKTLEIPPEFGAVVERVQSANKTLQMIII